MNIIPGSSCIPTYRLSGDRFKQEIINKMNSEQISGRVCRDEEDTNSVVMFTQHKRDRPKEPRLLPYCRPRNAVTIRNHSPLPNIEQVIEIVAARQLCSKIDLTDGYHNIRINPGSEKHNSFYATWDITEAASVYQSFRHTGTHINIRRTFCGPTEGAGIA